MRLTDREFRAMNNPLRRFFQRHLEFRVFRWLGLNEKNQDILEIGCGSGYGAVLLAQLRPKSYLGIDLMPEMIELARTRRLPGAEFEPMDATDLSPIPDSSKNIVVIFGILHHIPQWRQVIQQCHRVLRAGGRLFLEEPTGSAVRMWDAIFKWGHPKDAHFRRTDLEGRLREVGFSIERRIAIPGFATYSTRKGTAHRADS